MKNKILSIFREGFCNGYFSRIHEAQPLSLYIGKDDSSRFAFDYRGHFTPSRLAGSDVISVSQIKSQDDLFLRFSLEDADLLEYFCIFVQDLIESTSGISDDNVGYRIICSRYMDWKKLFKPNIGRLSELEIMGLIGELLFLKDYMIQSYGLYKAIESWTGPEKTYKDFSLDETWYEIKAINKGKESVHISSIEQLDSDIEGTLIIYNLEKMSPTFQGIKLNALVATILEMISETGFKEIFINKLGLFGFDFSPFYDNFVYVNTDYSAYAVTEDFPRVKRNDLSPAINKAQYEINIPSIMRFRKQ